MIFIDRGEVLVISEVFLKPCPCRDIEACGVPSDGSQRQTRHSSNAAQRNHLNVRSRIQPLECPEPRHDNRRACTETSNASTRVHRNKQCIFSDNVWKMSAHSCQCVKRTRILCHEQAEKHRSSCTRKCLRGCVRLSACAQRG